MAKSEINILHVTNRFSGGVKTAIGHIVDADPSDKHYLINLISSQLEEKLTGNFQATMNFNSKSPFAIRQVIKRACLDWKIDVIHAHSSWAGAYARVFDFGVPVVYQPHGLSFINPALGRTSRYVYLLVEKFLAPRAEAFIAVGNHERNVIAQHLPIRKVELVRNWSNYEIQPWKTIKPEKRILIGSVGRVCKEKDPMFFLELAGQLKKLGPNYSLIWVGAGESKLEQKLRAGGIRVTGWIDPAATKDQLQNLDVYVSTSISEAMPFAFLDAVASGVPIFLRKIPAFSEEKLPTFHSVEELASAIHEFVNGKENGAYLELFGPYRFSDSWREEIGRYRALLHSVVRK